MEKFYFVDVADCLRRKIDSVRVKEYLSVNGYESVETPAKADYFFINTCGVTNDKVDEALKTLNELSSDNCKIVMLGCVVSTDPMRIPEHVIKIPVDHMELLDQYFCHIMPFRSVPVPNKSDEGESLGYFTICRGCTEGCAYCATRKAIGSVKSLPVGECVKKFQKLLSQNLKKIVFDGDNIGAYGKDLGLSLGHLLNALPEVNSKWSLNLDMLHPVYFLESYQEIRKRVQRQEIGMLLVPFQSGSERILKLMRRRGDIQEVLEHINMLRREDPGMIIGTHIIIGFPSETDEEFLDTVRLLQTAQFDWVRVFCFSSRENTAAEKLQGHIDDEIMQTRLKSLVEKMKQLKYFAKYNPSGATFCRKSLAVSTAYSANPFRLTCFREVIDL